MLVLTRRLNQKVLFPHLGIAVEVVSIHGNSVRLGINAPQEIRIVRNELKPFDEPGQSGVAPQRSGNEAEWPDLRNKLNAANLAIHLAQNQLQQGLEDRAEDALEHALACLRDLDEVLSTQSPGTSVEFAVRESAAQYSAGGPRTALVVCEHCNERHRICETLKDLNYDIVVVRDGMSAIDWLADHVQPHVMLMMLQPGEIKKHDATALPEVQVGEIGGLRRIANAIPIGHRMVLGWTACDDAAATLQCGLEQLATTV